MAINKKLIHFNNKSTFNTQKVSTNSTNTSYKVGGVGTTISGAPDIKYQSIVFIKDTQEIWTHDKFYPCPFTKSELQSLLNNKVDKVTGKGLSTNDFDNTYKEILDYYDRSKGRYLECSGNARPATTYSVTLGNVYTGPLDDLTTEEIYIDAATTEKAGVMSAEDKTNLDTLTRWSKDDLGDMIDTGHTSNNVELYLKQAFTDNYSTAMINSATVTEAGVMSSSDKKYLDNIKGLGVIGTAYLGFSTDASTVYLDYDGISPTGSNINGGAIHIPAATTTDAGCMTSVDKQDLNNIKSTINNLSTTYLPLSGGQMNENAIISFENGITTISGPAISTNQMIIAKSMTVATNTKLESIGITTPTLTTTREIVCGDASEDNVNITQEGVAVNDYSNTGNYSVMGAGYIQLYEDTGGIDVTLTASDLQKLLALIK